MPKLTIEQIEKKIRALKSAHEKKEAEREKEYRKNGWDFTPNKFNTPIQWKPRLKEFSNKNNCFDPKSFQATSYRWWVYLKIIKGKVVFNDFSYSSSTSKHQSRLRILLLLLGIKIDLDVAVRGGLQVFETEALPPLYRQVFSFELDLENPRRSKKKDAERRAAIKRLKKQIKACRDLGAKFSAEQIRALRAEMNSNEKARLEKIAFDAAESRRLKRISKETAQAFNPAQLTA